MRQRQSTLRLILMIVVGLVATIITGVLGAWPYAPTVGWCFAALLFSTWVWLSIGRLDAAETKAQASREEPSRATAELLVLLLNIASLFSIVFVLTNASSAHGVGRVLLATLALVSVALSWFLLHTLYTLHYARQYYTADRGIEFNQTDPPQYTDFAYVAFTLGMTYQVSDTNISSHAIRLMVFRHSLMSFVFGSIILASAINLVVQLGN
jgi:uncharacterized membrane protein